MNSCQKLWLWATESRVKNPIKSEFLRDYEYWTCSRIVNKKRPKHASEVKDDDLDRAETCWNIVKGIGAAKDAFSKTAKVVSAADPDDIIMSEVVSEPQKESPLIELLDDTPFVPSAVKEELVDGFDLLETVNYDNTVINFISGGLLSALILGCTDVSSLNHSEKNKLIFALCATLKLCKTTLEKVVLIKSLREHCLDEGSPVILKALEEGLNKELAHFVVKQESDKVVDEIILNQTIVGFGSQTQECLDDVVASQAEAVAIKDYANACQELTKAKVDFEKLYDEFGLTEENSSRLEQQLEARNTEMETVTKAKSDLEKSKRRLSDKLKTAMKDIEVQSAFQLGLESELSESKKDLFKSKEVGAELQKQIDALKKRIPVSALKDNPDWLNDTTPDVSKPGDGFPRKPKTIAGLWNPKVHIVAEDDAAKKLMIAAKLKKTVEALERKKQTNIVNQRKVMMTEPKKLSALQHSQKRQRISKTKCSRLDCSDVVLRMDLAVDKMNQNSQYTEGFINSMSVMYELLRGVRVFVREIMKVVEKGDECDPKLVQIVCVKEMGYIAWIMRGSDVWFDLARDEFRDVTDIFNTRVAKNGTLKPDFLWAMENYILNVANR